MFNLNNFSFSPFRGGTGMPYGNVVRRVSSGVSGAFAAFIGLIFVVIGVFLVLDAQRTKDWPVISASIQDVRSHINYDDDGSSKTEYTYTLIYSVKDQQYSSSETSSSYVANGQQKQVAYNPENPKDSRDRSSPSWTSWIVVVIGAIGLLFGAFVSFKAPHKTAAPQAPVGMPIQPQPPVSPMVPVQPPVPPQSASQGGGPLPPTMPPLS